AVSQFITNVCSLKFTGMTNKSMAASIATPASVSPVRGCTPKISTSRMNEPEIQRTTASIKTINVAHSPADIGPNALCDSSVSTSLPSSLSILIGYNTLTSNHQASGRKNTTSGSPIIIQLTKLIS